MATSIPLPVVDMDEQLPLPGGSSDQRITTQPTITQAAPMQVELSDNDNDGGCQGPPDAFVQAVTNGEVTTMTEVSDLESFKKQPAFIRELQVSIVCPQIVISEVQYIIWGHFASKNSQMTPHSLWCLLWVHSGSPAQWLRYEQRRLL